MRGKLIFAFFSGVLTGAVLFFSISNSFQRVQSTVGRSLSKLVLSQSPSTRKPTVPKPTLKKKIQINDGWAEDINLITLRRLGQKTPLPSDSDLRTFNSRELNLLFHSYLDNNEIICNRKLRMGSIGDGGWEICDDPEWRPERPCIVYSFGVNYEFSFEDGTERVYGCQIYSFDPSMLRMNFTHKRSRHVTFFKLGIGGRKNQTTTKGWTLLTLSEIKAKLNHQKDVIDVLKMDVEYAEWASLTNMMNERQLVNVRQLLLEFHASSQVGPGRLTVLRRLREAGFRIFLTHKNPACLLRPMIYPGTASICYEVHYVNINFQRR